MEQSERSQQSKKYELAEILSTDKKAKLRIPGSSSVYESAHSSQLQDKQKKKASEFKSIRISDDSSGIVSGDLEKKKIQ